MQWVVLLITLASLINAIVGLLFSLGQAFAGTNKHPTEAQLIEFLILLCLGFGSTLVMLIAIGWLMYKNN